MSQLPWQYSRESDRWQHLAPSEARDALIEAYDEDSRQEALLRAFLAELERDREQARFWVAVYDLIAIATELDLRIPPANDPGWNAGR
jgi:hypothetical protein